MMPKRGSPEWHHLHSGSIQEFLESQGFKESPSLEEYQRTGPECVWAIHFLEIPGRTVLEFARRGEKDGWLNLPPEPPAPPPFYGFVF